MIVESNLQTKRTNSFPSLCVTIIVWDSGDIKSYPRCNNKARRNEEENRERKEGVSAEGAGSKSWNWEALWEGQKVNDAVKNKNALWMCVFVYKRLVLFVFLVPFLSVLIFIWKTSAQVNIL